jgi:hypothetical protein
MSPLPDPDDPKGLIREAYAIDGIGPAECRSILVDWALSLPTGADPGAAIVRLGARYGAGHADHPMTRLLAEATAAPVALPARRGGRAGRHGSAPYPVSRG